MDTRPHRRSARGLLPAGVLAVAALVLLAWGCAGGEELLGQVSDGTASGAGAGASSQGGAGATHAGTGGEPMPISVGGAGGAPGPLDCYFGTCSADGLSVLDCDGNVVETCTGSDRCVNANCIANPCLGDDPTNASMGCDFYAAQPTYRGFFTFCFALYLVNPWPEHAHIAVEWQGAPLQVENFAAIASGQGKNTFFTPYDPVAGVPPGEVAVLFFHDFDDPYNPVVCPYESQYLPFATSGPSTGIDDAIHVTTDVPNVAYQMLPYGDSGVTSATLLLPTRTWDTDYLAVSSWGDIPGGGSKPTLAVVASEDATTVFITPKVPIEGDAVVSPGPANVTTAYALDRGQVLSLYQVQELTGSLVQSDKPIGLFGGFECLQIPYNTQWCDTSHQQIPPIRALGSEYVGLRHRNRYPDIDEAPPWRLVGAANGTVLTWDPAPPPGAPLTLEAQQVVELETAGPFVVRSQDAEHPFYMAAYMSGCRNYGTDDDCRGDPEWVNVVPTDQYLDSYTIFTDPNFPETSLNLVRREGPQGFSAVYVDCLGEVAGWQDVGDYQVAIVDLSVGNFEPVGQCTNGVHRVFSQGAFALTVWGWGSAATGALQDPNGVYTQQVSYAYPGGIGLATINDIQLPPPDPLPK